MTNSTPPGAPRLRRRLMLTWAFASLAAAIVCFVVYRREARQIEQATRDREGTRVTFFGRLFDQDFRDAASDVRVLSESDDLKDCLEEGQPDRYARLQRDMLLRLNQQGEYDLIKFIDETGTERVRAGRGSTQPGAIPVQSIGDRPYFREALALAPGQIYVSALSLSQENGKVLQPLKPIMRLATPAFDRLGLRRGVLVVNYLGEELLNKFKFISPANAHRMRVLNPQGYWLRGADPTDEWGFQIPDRADRTLAHDEPELWQAILAKADGQLPFRGGWFTWQRIEPATVIGQAKAADSFLVIASEFTAEEWADTIRDRQQSYLFLGIVLVAMTAGAGWFSYTRQRERERAENALRMAHDAAQESARLKAQFLANMSHEIRTPMNGVVGMTGLLLDTPLTAEQRSLANTVRTSADSLLTIINDILDFSKIEAGQLEFETEPFDLRVPVENCLSLVAEKAHRKALELAYLIEDNVPLHLIGDANRLHQILLNLIGNALKFTERGEVILRVAKVSDREGVAVLRFSVRDTGIGIAPEVQGKLFQPFVQADTSTTRRFGGTGLGLAISRELVSLLGGEIGLESKPGVGTTFWFTAKFPIASAPLKGIAHKGNLEGLRALIVDDNETNREILVRQLSAWRVNPVAVSGGTVALEALRAAARAGAPFQFAVLDMQMPGRSGLEVAKAIHQDPEIAGLKMLILTSIGHSLPGHELEAAGVGLCLAKPARQSQLHDALIDLLAGKSSGRSEQEPLTVSERKAAAKLRILVAEDHEVNQHVARLQLEKFGYNPTIVGSGREAVEAVQANPYDLVFMDCQMPDVDGFEATRQIRAWEEQRRTRGESFTPVRIVAMTANAMAGDRETCLAAGMQDYISKPVRAHTLAAALARIEVPGG